MATGGFDVNLNPLDPSQAILLDVRAYDGAGRLVRNGPAGTAAGSLPAAYIAALNAGGQSDANGAISRVNRYDANGRLMAQHVTKADGSFDYDTIYAGTYTSDVLVETGQDESGNPVFTAQTITQTGPGYDAAGNILGYRVTDSSGVTSSYNMTLARFEGYKEAAVSGFRSDTGEVRTSTNQYDAGGHLVGITDDTGVDTAHRQFVNDANGIVLQKTQQANVFKQLVVMGQVMASYGLAENPQSPGSYTNQTTFDTNYQPITSGYPSAGTGAYTVRTGDSLQTIAQAAYGDSQLWYLIADANGLAGNSDLRVGQTVSIPTKVGSIHNTAGTYKPYDPSQVIGSTTPTLPVPQSGGGDDCGGLGLVILIIVAVVVTVLTEGATSEFLIAALGETGGTIAAAAVGAAAGSVASQVVGMAIGVVDEFSWKAVALAALTAGVTKGLPAGNLLGTTAGTIGNSIVRAAVANAMTQGIAVAVGLQDHFDWRGVAASAIGAGVGQAVGTSLSGTDINPYVATGLRTFAAGAATAMARGGKVAIAQIAADAFGNTLGSSLGEQILQGGQQEDRLGNFINEQEAAQTQRDNAAAKTSFRQSEIAYQNETESAPNSMGGGSGLRLGGIGIRFPSSAVKDWSDGIDGGIRQAAASLPNVTTFSPEFYPDGTKPIYDFGDPLAVGGRVGDLLTANGGATQLIGRSTRQSFTYENRIDPVLNTVAPKTGTVPSWVLDVADAKLHAGDRGGAYLTLYRELGNEQLLIQAQITTYTGVWGSGALTGNAWAKAEGQPRGLYNLTLDKFSEDIAQGTINAIRENIRDNGTGRLSDDEFQRTDRKVWASKDMGKLFPGNSQFGDFIVGNHSLSEGLDATFSRGTWNAIGIGARTVMPDTGWFGLNTDGRNVANQVGKRPAEYANDSNYTTYGGDKDRFITVIDNRNGFVEAFYDKRPHLGAIPLPQLPNVPLDPNSLAYHQRQTFYNYLGANMNNAGRR